VLAISPSLNGSHADSGIAAIVALKASSLLPVVDVGLISQGALTYHANRVSFY